MPEYLVRFDQTVSYQPSHPCVVAKRIDAMCVGAPTPEDAVQHAIRVTLGPGRVISVVDAADAPDEASAVKLLISQRVKRPTEEVLGAPA